MKDVINDEEKYNNTIVDGILSAIFYDCNWFGRRDFYEYR